MSKSPFASVEMAPRDPILGLTELYKSDSNSSKVNLGVGVYYDDSGKVPLLECVSRAEQQLVASAKPRAYLPIDGLPAYVAKLFRQQSQCSAEDKGVSQIPFIKEYGAIKGRDSQAVSIVSHSGPNPLKDTARM